MKTVIAADPPVNQAPPDLDPSRDLPRGFYEFLTPLHRTFTPRQQALAARRRQVLEATRGGKLPDYLGASEATTGSWKVSLPGWCQDQRNQMTGPGDDAELVVKMLNSGAPGVMLDLEDSVANAWPNIIQGIANIIAALRGELTYQDRKRNREVSINDSKTVIYTRPRGLHLEQAGVIKGERMAAALFDMASLIDFTLHDPAWVLPDRNTIPHDVAFFQAVREVMPEVCHKRGMLAIGGMTALYPSREDPELNARALKVLEQDKKNEAKSLMDGAWTGHPDQNEIAVNQFPYPNQVQARRPDADIHKDLRPSPKGVGKRTLQGTRDAVRTVIRYRNGVFNGKGASLLDGYMEDLATDRIYRYMIAQRTMHEVKVPKNGGEATHSPALVSQLFDEELDRLLKQWPKNEAGSPDTMRQARDLAEGMVLGILQAQGVSLR